MFLDNRNLSRFYPAQLLVVIFFVSLASLISVEAQVVEQSSEVKIKAQLLLAERLATTDLKNAQIAVNSAYELAVQKSNVELQIQALLIKARFSRSIKKYYLVHQYLSEVETKLSKINNIELQLDAYILMVEVKTDSKSYNEALIFVNRYLEIAEIKADIKRLYTGYRKKAIIYLAQKQFKEALPSYLAAHSYTATLSEKIKLESFDSLSIIYKYLNDNKMRVRYLHESLDYLTTIDNFKAMPKVLIKTAQAHRQLGNYESSVKYGNKALKMAKVQGDKRLVAWASVVLSRVYRKLSSYEDALKYAIEAVDNYKKLDNINGFASAANATGLIYNRLKQEENAIEYFDRVLNLPADKVNPKYLAAALRELGQYYFKHQNKEKGLALVKQSFEIYLKLKNIKGAASVKKILGKFYQNLGNNKQALIEYNAAIEDSRLIGDRWSEARNLIYVGLIQLKTDPETAKATTLSALALAKSIDAKSVSEHAYSTLISIEEKLENVEKVTEYEKIKSKISMELKQEKFRKRSNELHIMQNIKNSL